MEVGLISVDRWTQGSQAYFLTHLHSDHTQGLSPTWSRGPLFCSGLTAKLLPFKFPGLDLSLLRVLETGTWQSIPLTSPSTGDKTAIEVLAIDAHHCPGAVMLLFRGEFGCLLFTGDFRWETSCEKAKASRALLVEALKHEVVDILYLDNTYCNPSFNFPPRLVAAKQVVDVIVNHPHHDIVIGIDTLGKEDLLLHISRVLNIKIWVWPERLQTMHLLGFNDVFTTKTALTRVRAIPRYSFSIDTLECLNTIRPTIGIMPSGLPWLVKPHISDENISGSDLTFRYNSNDGEEVNVVERYHKYAYSVPYSDHSCFTELEEFIKLVHPTNIKGIVKSSPCYVEPMYYFGPLCAGNQPSVRKLDRRRVRGGKRVVTVEAKLKAENGHSSEPRTKRKRTVMLRFLGGQASKVNYHRRSLRGAKIEQSENSV